MKLKQVRGPTHLVMIAFFFCSTVVLAGVNS